jgi:hypothetical protein
MYQCSNNVQNWVWKCHLTCLGYLLTLRWLQELPKQETATLAKDGHRPLQWKRPASRARTKFKRIRGTLEEREEQVRRLLSCTLGSIHRSPAQQLGTGPQQRVLARAGAERML